MANDKKSNVSKMLGRNLWATRSAGKNLVLNFEENETYTVQLGLRNNPKSYSVLPPMSDTVDESVISTASNGVRGIITAVRFTKTYSIHNRLTYELWLQVDRPLKGLDWVIHSWHVPEEHQEEDVVLLWRSSGHVPYTSIVV